MFVVNVHYDRRFISSTNVMKTFLKSECVKSTKLTKYILIVDAAERKQNDEGDSHCCQVRGGGERIIRALNLFSATWTAGNGWDKRGDKDAC